MAELVIRHATERLPGGIHPEMHKELSNGSPLKRDIEPTKLYFPVHHSGGGTGRALVAPGDRVEQGTPLIETQSGLIHSASRAGIIEAIEPLPVVHPSNAISDTVILEVDPSGSVEYLTPLEWPWTVETLVQRALETGILGLGGAGFPSAYKWGAHQVLIVNGAECEPYLTADDALMRSDPYSIIRGAYFLAKTYAIETVVIGIEDNKPGAIDALSEAIESGAFDARFEIVILPTRYPSGGERQLIWLTRGIEINSGTHPTDHGILVHNPGTLAALSRAIDGKRLTDRVVSITGECINEPQNILAPIGTSLADLCTAATTDIQTLETLTIGGPMMGFSVDRYALGITKTTHCLLARPRLETLATPCIRCGACAEACPVNLQPQQMYQALTSDALDRAAHEGLADCIECAACNAVCPSHIPLAEWFKHGRSELQHNHRTQQRADAARARFEARGERLERIKKAQEAKRQARRTQGTDALAQLRKVRENRSP